MDRNAVGWFEIPVSNMDRAVKFYETILGYKLSRNKFDKLEMAWFPSSEKPGSSGSLVYHEQFYKPSQDGVLIYFSSPSGDLNNELTKVESACGKILIPRRQISEEYGYMAVILDTEGNKIALHSAK